MRARCGVEQWQLVGLITRRSQVRILAPLPGLTKALPAILPEGFFLYREWPITGCLRRCVQVQKSPRHSTRAFCRSWCTRYILPFSETYTNLGKSLRQAQDKPRLLFGSCFTEVCPHDAGLTSSPQASLKVEFVAN